MARVIRVFLAMPTRSAQISFRVYVVKSQQYLGYIKYDVQFWGPGYVELCKVIRDSAEYTEV